MEIELGKNQLMLKIDKRETTELIRLLSTAERKCMYEGDIPDGFTDERFTYWMNTKKILGIFLEVDL